MQDIHRHGSCRAEHFAKDTSEDLDRDLPEHTEKKNHGRVRKKAFVSRQKPSCEPEVTPLAPVKEEKQIKCRCLWKKNPEKPNGQRDRNQEQIQSSFSKLSGARLTIVRTNESSGTSLCVLSLSFNTFQLLFLSS